MSRTVPEWRGRGDDTPIPDRVKDRIARKAEDTCQPEPSYQMTLDELVNETLTHKNMRLRWEKCRHEEVYYSAVISDAGTFTNSVCLDCGKSWRSEVSSKSTLNYPSCQRT